jgi:hypothetical protein
MCDASDYVVGAVLG